jgi:hypothetical protein
MTYQPSENEYRTEMRKKQSLYVIPRGCICMGDGLMGMTCNASEHARLVATLAGPAGEAE